MQHRISQDETSRDAKLNRVLLLGGVVAGPLYVLVGAIEMLTRPGFDVTRHDLSLMSNGDWGWVHSSLLILTGLLTCACAVGMRRVLRGSRGGTWVPILLGIYGLGLIGAGFFSADPALGFPPGTPADAHSITWHGLMHFVSGGVGFLSLIAGCFVFARRFAGGGEGGWAAYSVVTGMVFFLSFAGIAAGSGNGWTILGFWIGVVLAWSWITASELRLIGAQDRPA